VSHSPDSTRLSAGNIVDSQSGRRPRKLASDPEPSVDRYRWTVSREDVTSILPSGETRTMDTELLFPRVPR
jgi:hypothetical protein